MAQTETSLIQRPIIGVGAIVWKGDQILLIRRGQEPHIGRWSFPGGRQELGETVFEAAIREIREETNVEIRILDVTAVIDWIEREAGTVSLHYTIIDVNAEFVSGNVVAGDDAMDAIWAGLDDLDRYDLTPAVLDTIAKAKKQREATFA